MILLLWSCAHRVPVGEHRWATPQGDLVLACALDTCNLALDGKGRPVPLARDLWTFDPANSLREIAPGVWLAEVTEGDACPSMYRLVCPAAGKATAPFGNCNELAAVVPGEQPYVRFDAFPEADRHAQVFRLDPVTCGRLEVRAGD